MVGTVLEDTETKKIQNSPSLEEGTSEHLLVFKNKEEEYY